MPEETKPNPPGVSDIPTGGANEDLGKRLAEMQAKQKEYESRETQYIAALNRMAERLPAEQHEPEPEPQDFDPETSKILERRVGAKLSPIEQQLQMQSDQIDQMMFMQYAAAAGVNPAQVAEAEHMHQGWRESGLSTVDKKGVRRTPTRREALAFVTGNGAINAMMKDAPNKSMQALRQTLLGQAAFENPGAATRTPSTGLAYEEIEAKPLNERMKLREQALDKEGF